jgi:hypothetical protein
MAMRRAKSKSSGFAPLARLLPADVAALVRSKAMDLSGVSVFCRRQAECAALFGSIVQIKPGVFELKSPYKENFIGSLLAFLWRNANFSPEEMVANALVRHATWYLKSRDIDAVRARAGGERIQPQALRGSMKWMEGIVRPTGEFTQDPEADGKPAILVWQDTTGNLPGFAIEVCGPGVNFQGPVFRTLLQSMVDSLTVALELKRPGAGRPHLATQAEAAAYYRDHQKAGRAQIAKSLCSCGRPHTQKCFDRLNKLADSFYRTQRSAFEKLVRDQTRKYSEINS